MTTVLYLAFAGSDPDDPNNLAIPILQGQKRSLFSLSAEPLPDSPADVLQSPLHIYNYQVFE